MNNMEIRRMVESDIDNLAPIMLEVFNNEIWNNNWSFSRAKAYLLDFYNNKKFLGFTALDNKKIVGGIFGYEKVWWDNDEIFIEEFFISPRYQGKSIGSMLLMEVEKYAKARNIGAICLLTNKNSKAYDFYAKKDFTLDKEIVCMHKVVK